MADAPPRRQGAAFAGIRTEARPSRAWVARASLGEQNIGRSSDVRTKPTSTPQRRIAPPTARSSRRSPGRFSRAPQNWFVHFTSLSMPIVVLSVPISLKLDGVHSGGHHPAWARRPRAAAW
jgi:hypothetical protein